MSSKSRRRKSFVGQWDKTTSGVNVKQKYYVSEVGKYTDIQKETFTRWVNIQLRSIHKYDFPNSDNNSSSNESLVDKIPEIKDIEKDFRDGTRLIKLLEVLYEGDPELPKRERGNTRHHHIANVSNVLDFLKKRLDESGLAALQAIGPVDIVDGNVKLTLGLIWLIISRFHQMVSVFKAAVNEEELAVAKAQSSGGANKNLNSNLWLNLDIESIESHINKLELIINNDGDDGDDNGDNVKDEVKKINAILEDEKLEKVKEDSLIEGQQKKEKEEKSNVDKHLGENSVNVNNNLIHNPKMSLNPRQSINIMNNYNKRMSLPAIANKDFRPPPKRFRTLRSNDFSASLSSSSGLLFWLNMQLVNYASVLPSSSYPIEDFTGLNSGVILSALIHHNNMGHFEDFDLLIKDPPNKDESAIIKLDESEAVTKERLQKCFNIIEEKLGVESPKALISRLIENNVRLNKEQIDGETGAPWSAYISEVFIALSNKNEKKTKKDQVKLSIEQQEQQKIDDNISKEVSMSPTVVEVFPTQSMLFDEPEPAEERDSTTKDLSVASSSLSPLPSWTPKKPLATAIWDWAMNWMTDDNDGALSYDEYEDGGIDNNGRHNNDDYVEDMNRNLIDKNLIGIWNIQNVDEWIKD